MRSIGSGRDDASLLSAILDVHTPPQNTPWRQLVLAWRDVADKAVHDQMSEAADRAYKAALLRGEEITVLSKFSAVPIYNKANLKVVY